MNEYVNNVCASGRCGTGADWRSRNRQIQCCAGTIYLVPAANYWRTFWGLQK